VTRRTLTGESGVIHRDHGEQCGAGVACVALPVVRDVGRPLAYRCRAVMADRTATRGGGVMHVLCGLPRGCCMADIALHRRGDVGGRLGKRALTADGDVSTTVTSRALSGGAVVTHHRGTECREVRVAVVAGTCGRDVGGRLGQAAAAALVAGGTGVVADDYRGGGQCVVEGGRCPGGGRLVACIALLRRGNVGSGLGLGVLAGVGAAMAGRTLAGQAGVVHGAYLETGRAGVAGVALGAGRDMGAPLARGHRAVVAGRTLAHC